MITVEFMYHLSRGPLRDTDVARALYQEHLSTFLGQQFGLGDVNKILEEIKVRRLTFFLTEEPDRLDAGKRLWIKRIPLLVYRQEGEKSQMGALTIFLVFRENAEGDQLKALYLFQHPILKDENLDRPTAMGEILIAISAVFGDLPTQ